MCDLFVILGDVKGKTGKKHASKTDEWLFYRWDQEPWQKWNAKKTLTSVTKHYTKSEKY